MNKNVCLWKGRGGGRRKGGGKEGREKGEKLSSVTNIHFLILGPTMRDSQ